ncbi:MAG: hypothetical protein V2I25_00050 [Woeseiaceae bacterium]|jgi:hypothetical protein|nr:hypothetical protein [Woeseiaceae bacterium]
MRLGRYLSRLSPWTVLAVCGCAALVVVDYWRGQGPTALPLVRGVLPNLVAVPTLAFGFLMLRFPERQRFDAPVAAQQDRYFWGFWMAATVGTIAWEFAQLTGNLVFDPLDIAATLAGAAVAAGLFRMLRNVAFIEAE